MKTKSQVLWASLSPAKRWALGCGSRGLANRVRHEGAKMGLGLGEGLIGCAAVQIAQAEFEGKPLDPMALILYSQECGVQPDEGGWRPLNRAEAEQLLAVPCRC